MREMPAAYTAGAPTPALLDALYREDVLAARSLSPEEKFLAGEELFNYACRITLAGIKNQFPGADESECMRVLEERLALRARLDSRR